MDPSQEPATMNTNNEKRDHRLGSMRVNSVDHEEETKRYCPHPNLANAQRVYCLYSRRKDKRRDLAKKKRQHHANLRDFPDRACFADEEPQALNWSFSLNSPQPDVVWPGDDPEQKYVFKLVEDIGMLTYHLVRGRNATDYGMALVNFCKLRIEDPLLSKQGLSDIKTTVETWYTKLKNQLWTTMAPQSNTDVPILDELRDMLDKYTEIKNSEIYIKFYKFLMYALSLNLCERLGYTLDSCGYSKLEQAAIRSKYHAGPDFVHSMLDTALFIVERGTQCFKSGSLEPMFHSGSSYEKWYTKVRELTVQKNFLTNPQAHGIQLEQFYSDLEDCIQKGKCMVKYASLMGPFQAKTTQKALIDLEMIKAEWKNRKSAQEMRQVPFSISLTGAPKVGKSTFQDIMFHFFSKLYDKPNDSSFKYTRSPQEEYWNGFSTPMWCIIFDDIAFKNPAMSTELERCIEELLMVVNNVPFSPDQAAIELKGTTPVKADLVIATTNTPHLNADFYFSCPYAVRRRLPYTILIEPKPEYCAEDGKSLDPSKVPPLKLGHYFDYWHIKIYTVRAVGAYPHDLADGNAKFDLKSAFDLKHTFLNIYDFLAWFREVTYQHREIQKNLMESCSALAEVVLCSDCVRPQDMCTCHMEEGWFDEYSRILNSDGVNALTQEEMTRYVDELRRRNLLGGAEPQIRPLDLDTLYSIVLMCVCETTSSDELSEMQTHYLNLYAQAQQQDTYNAYLNLQIQSRILYRAQLDVHAEIADTYLNAIPEGSERYRRWESDWIMRQAGYENLFTATATWRWRWLSWFTPALYFFTYYIVWVYTLSICFVWDLVSLLFNPLEGIKFTYTRSATYYWYAKLLYYPWFVMCSYKIAGDRVASALGTTKQVFKVAGAITMCYGIYKTWTFFRSFTSEPLLNAESGGVDLDILGKKPTVRDEERQNVYYKNDFQLTPFEISPKSSSWKGLPQNQVHKLIHNNCMHLEIIWEDHEQNKKKIRSTKGFAVWGRYILLNLHALPETQDFIVNFTMAPHKDGVNANLHGVLLTQDCVVKDPRNDIAMLFVRNLPTFPKLIDLFMKEGFDGIHNAMSLSKSILGVPRVKHIERNHLIKNFDYSFMRKKFDIWLGFVPEYDVSVEGDCGSVLITHTEFGPVILGIHVGGSVGTDPGYAEIGTIAVTFEQVDDLIQRLMKKFKEPHVLQAGVPALVTPTVEKILGALDRKSCFRYLESGSARVYGSFVGKRVKPKSRVEPTYICEIMRGFNYNVKTGPPVMTGWSPWRNALLGMINPPRGFNPTKLHECAEFFLQDILRGLGNGALKDVHPYDYMTAINGAPGVAYVDGIDRNTSMGSPWHKCKKFYLKAIEPYGDLQHPVIFDDEVKERVQEIIDNYLNGYCSVPIFTGSLKDEATKLAKILAQLTRMFCGGPVDHTIVTRMYLLSIVRLINKNRFVFETAIGTIAQSTEWEDIRTYLCTFGEDRLIAGDYTNFDKSMSAPIMYESFWIIKQICMKAGYSDEDMKIVCGIAEDLTFPTVDVNGDLAQFYGVNASGQPLTTPINGLANSLYNRYIYAENSPDGTCRHFKRDCKLITYGDDMAMGVSNDVDWFNHTVIQQGLAQYGIGYTMADKTSESVPFIHIDQVSFLKRTWRFDEEIGHYLCPLEHSSIEKMLTMCVRSKTITPKEQAIEVIATALREYFYYGRKTFEKRREMFIKVIDLAGLQPYVSAYTLPTWNELKQQFYANSDLEGQESMVPLETKMDSLDAVTARFADLQSLPQSREWVSDVYSPERSSKLFLNNGAGWSPRQRRILDMDVPPDPDCINRYSKQQNRTIQNRSCDWPVQSHETDMLLNLTDGELGALVRHSWVSGQHLSHKKYLLEQYQEITRIDWRRFPIALRRQAIITIQATIDADQASDEEHNFSTQAPQSAEVTSAEMVSGTEPTGVYERQQVMQFHDETPGTVRGSSTANESSATFDAHDQFTGLSDFLSRPVNLHVYSWNENDPVGQTITIDPWTLFFSNQAVKDKLNNYSWIRADLKLKFMINASQFYYGATQVSYQPLPTFTINDIPDDSSGFRHFILYSQRPQFLLLPQNSEGGEMTLPFVWPRNWLWHQVATEVAKLGRIKFSIWDTLKSGNGQIGQGCTVLVQGWLENMTLSGPSVGRSMQAKTDEYGKEGPISVPASAVAKAAGELKKLPIIGPLATATEMGARAIAAGAAALGYTNEPVITSAGPMRNMAFPMMASPEISYPFEKLTVDPKAELSIDPRIVGLDGSDELSISHLVSKESLIARANWSTTATPDTILFSSLVQPALFDRVGGNDQTIYMTPSCWVSQLFRWWRGDIIFRFHFIASMFHKGRVRIMWDPAGTSGYNVINQANSSNLLQNTIVDLGKDSNVEIRVPYNQAMGWCFGNNPSTTVPFSTSSSPSFNYSGNFSNGTIVMRVQTALTAGVADAPVTVLVYARCADNFELGGPSEVLPDSGGNRMRFSYFPPQSKLAVEEAYEDKQNIQEISFADGTIGQPHTINLTNFGESVISLRQLMRRMSLSRMTCYPTGLVNTAQLYKMSFHKLPLQPGYDPNGDDFAYSVVITTSPPSKPYNWVQFTPLSWISPAFIAMRGSTNWSFNVFNGNTPLSHVRVYRVASGSITPTQASNSIVSTIDSTSRYANFFATYAGTGCGGQSITSQITNAGINVVCPNYNPMKFGSPGVGVPSYPGSTGDFSDYDCYIFESLMLPPNSASTFQLFLSSYVGIGADFNLHFFLNVPALYLYRSIPAPSSN